MQLIAPHIYYDNSFAGVTIGALTMPKGTLLIDTPFRSDEGRTWKAALLTQSRGTHRLIVVLDGHTDRLLGCRAVEYPILMHENTAKIFADRSAIFKGQNTGRGAEWESFPEVTGTHWARPNMTFQQQLHLHWGEDEIHIEHQPGPTSGSSWVHIPSQRIIFVGDIVTPHQPPFLALANIDDWIETLNLLSARQFRDYTFIGGRSGILSIEDVREQRKFLKSVQGRLETLSKRNGTPEDTEKLITPLLRKISYSARNETYFAQRLRYGLATYYARLYG
ncbi:MAG: hypothetical protein IZT55_02175 [Anaerolineae bacterium]|nr:hypothetical protein [Anaerolineae bacterium]